MIDVKDPKFWLGLRPGEKEKAGTTIKLSDAKTFEDTGTWPEYEVQTVRILTVRRDDSDKVLVRFVLAALKNETENILLVTRIIADTGDLDFYVYYPPAWFSEGNRYELCGLVIDEETDTREADIVFGNFAKDGFEGMGEDMDFDSLEYAEAVTLPYEDGTVQVAFHQKGCPLSGTIDEYEPNVANSDLFATIVELASDGAYAINQLLFLEVGGVDEEGESESFGGNIEMYEGYRINPTDLEVESW